MNDLDDDDYEEEEEKEDLMDAKKWKNDDFLIKLILINLKM
jgi:hypothetical protein